MASGCGGAQRRDSGALHHWYFARKRLLSVGLILAIGKLLIGLYLGRSAIASSYGAAGSLSGSVPQGHLRHN